MSVVLSFLNDLIFFLCGLRYVIRILFVYLVGFISLFVKFVHIMINVENLYFADCDGKDFSVLIVDKLYENLHSN